MYSNIDEVPQSVQDYSDSFFEHSKSEQEKFEEEWKFYVSQIDCADSEPIEDGQYYVSPDAVGADAPNFECEDLPW